MAGCKTQTQYLLNLVNFNFHISLCILGTDPIVEEQQTVNQVMIQNNLVTQDHQTKTFIQKHTEKNYIKELHMMKINGRGKECHPFRQEETNQKENMDYKIHKTLPKDEKGTTQGENIQNILAIQITQRLGVLLQDRPLL